MNHLKTILVLAFALHTTFAADHSKKIFDGKSFKGWEGDTNKTWRIQDGPAMGTQCQPLGF